MKITDFTYILEHPKKISETLTRDLKSIIFKYPYFQTGHALHLKGLKNSDSNRYNEALKITAAHTTDRSILFDFITSQDFLQNNISKQIKLTSLQVKDLEVAEEDDISVNKRVLIDIDLLEQIQGTKDLLDPELFKAKNPWQVPVKPHFNLEDTPTEITPEDALQLGKPLEFNKAETHSFVEWLKLTNFKPIDREVPSETAFHTPSIKSKKFDLIDKFIENNPKIPPIKKERPSTNLAKANIVASETLMTETLARIYLEQKNYTKAIQSYKILSLKYPEKSGYFADQIKAVKQLQEQNKKE